MGDLGHSFFWSVVGIVRNVVCQKSCPHGRIASIDLCAICASLLLLLFLPTYLVGMAILIPLYGLFFNAHQPALTALAGTLSPYEQRGAVFGIFFLTFFGIGSVSQLIAGYVADVYGLDMAFYLLTIFAAVALLLCFRLPEERKRV